SHRRVPWWLYVIGASYLFSLGFTYYLVIWGPTDLLGFVATFDGDAMAIHLVNPQTEVAQGGLRAGDRVLMINERPIQNVPDWTEANANSWISQPDRWLVDRDGKRVTLEIASIRKNFLTKLAMGYAQLVILALTGYFLGFLIAWKRPADPVARIG